MRRVLKAMVQGTSLGDLTTIEEEGVIEEIQVIYREFQLKIQKV